MVDNKLSSIQYLRGLAALLVVMVHCRVQLDRMGYEGYWPDFLAVGVDIFFVISGFIMWTTTFHQTPTPEEFLYRRFTRIAPLYWFLTSITVAVMIVAPSALQSGRFDLIHILKSYLFIPSVHPVTGMMEPTLVPGWTLNLEIFFYIIFAGCLLLKAMPRLVVLVSILAFFVSLNFLPLDPTSVLSFYSSNIVLEFGAGALLGAAYVNRTPISRKAAMFCLLGGVLTAPLLPILGNGLPRVIQAGFPALLMVAGVVMSEESGLLVRSNTLRRLGDASYSLYLSHGIVLSAASQIWRKIGASQIHGAYAGFVIAALLSSSAVAIVIYHIVERPMISLFRSKLFLRTSGSGKIGYRI